MNVTNSVTKTQTKGTCDLSTSTALHTLDSLRRDITSVGYCSGDKIEKNETGGARGRGETYTGFWWINLVERDHLDDPGADRRII